jgi:hypothetical protein
MSTAHGISGVSQPVSKSHQGARRFLVLVTTPGPETSPGGMLSVLREHGMARKSSHAHGVLSGDITFCLWTRQEFCRQWGCRAVTWRLRIVSRLSPAEIRPTNGPPVNSKSQSPESTSSRTVADRSACRLPT